MSAVAIHGARAARLSSLIDEALREEDLDRSDQEIALAILNDNAHSRRELLDLVLPAVTLVVHDARRAFQQQLEQAVTGSTPKRPNRRLMAAMGFDEDAEPLLAMPAIREQFAKEHVFVPSRGPVAWAEMTVADHQERLTWLERMRDRYTQTVTETIERHQWAIEILKKSNCPNLAAYWAKQGVSA